MMAATSSQSSARLAATLVFGCILASAIVPLMLATLEITRLVGTASLSTLITLACLFVVVTALIVRAVNDDQRYSLFKIFFGIEFILIVSWLSGAPLFSGSS